MIKDKCHLVTVCVWIMQYLTLTLALLLYAEPDNLNVHSESLLFSLLSQNSDTGQRCPVDNEMLSEDQLFPDNFAKREILSLTVRCPNSGCDDKMELRHLEVSEWCLFWMQDKQEHENKKLKWPLVA